MGKRSCAVALIAVLCAGIAAGCPGRARIERAAAEQLISPEESVRLGAELHAELERQDEVRFVDDPEVLGYAQEVFEGVLPAASDEREEMAWALHVIDDDEMVNAFAAPGGYIYLTTGFLLAANDEAEVAGVLAHELGHITAWHIERRLVTMFGLSAVQQLVLGSDPGTLGEMAGQIAATGVLLSHSRADELEADRLGFGYAAATGYDPRGLIGFLETMQEMQEVRPPAFLSTHPAPEQRIEEGKALIEAEGLEGGRAGTDRLSRIQARIRGGAPADDD